MKNVNIVGVLIVAILSQNSFAVSQQSIDSYGALKARWISLVVNLREEVMALRDSDPQVIEKARKLSLRHEELFHLSMEAATLAIDEDKNNSEIASILAKFMKVDDALHKLLAWYEQDRTTSSKVSISNLLRAARDLKDASADYFDYLEVFFVPPPAAAPAPASPVVTSDPEAEADSKSPFKRGLTSHEMLGLSKGASQDEIKTAYRRLARVWHPDRHQNELWAKEAFVRLSAAYKGLGGT